MMAAPDWQAAHKQLPAVLKLLTQISLESIADLLPDREDGDALLAQHFEKVSALCAQVQLDADKMNPTWNKTYGEGGTSWQGELDDGRDRGGIPYFCPKGWVRFALNVCPDKDFESRFQGWGYLYHGTKGKHVGSILTSGFRASKGLCYCGQDDHAVYMSPSVEYCSHPRYGTIEYNPETKKWVQVVLQCRVDPKAVWKVGEETLRCSEFGIRADPNISNDRMEWLFKPNFTDPDTRDKFINEAIVCTGIMLRVTDQHPYDLCHWWSRNQEYARYWRAHETKVDPLQSRSFADTAAWKSFDGAVLATYQTRGDPCGDDMFLEYSERDVSTVRLSPAPFANGSMRYAWYLWAGAKLYVVKTYNDELVRHIEEGLDISLEEALVKDVRTYMVAQHYAKQFAQSMKDASIDARYSWNWQVNFVRPVSFKLGDSWFFGERYLQGDFVKWNTNTGENNLAEEAKIAWLDDVAASFSHFTYVASKGKLMVVDIQGLTNASSVVFTDPQIHSRPSGPSKAKKRKRDMLYRRFSVGNLGKAGMMRFFANHKCNGMCRALNLKHPLLENSETCRD